MEQKAKVDTEIFNGLIVAIKNSKPVSITTQLFKNKVSILYTIE